MTTVKRKWAPKRRAAARPVVAPRTPDEWERGWRRTWKKLGFEPYELPPDDSPAREGAYIVMPEGLGTLDEFFEAATLIQCGKIGPFPLVLMGSRFWAGLRRFGRFMMREGVFAADELGFGHVTDSPRGAVGRIVRALPPAVRGRLTPVARAKPEKRAR
jgi:hypothetical protein